MDYYIEHKLNKDDAYAHNLKGKKFDERMTRLREAQRIAPTQEEYDRLKKLEKYTLSVMNKYQGKNIKN